MWGARPIMQAGGAELVKSVVTALIFCSKKLNPNRREPDCQPCLGISHKILKSSNLDCGTRLAAPRAGGAMDDDRRTEDEIGRADEDIVGADEFEDDEDQEDDEEDVEE
jgi:hypothetical protein